MQDKPTICIDFDGVIHRYGDGWQDGKIYDGITAGFWPWALKAQRLFRLVIYSSRSRHDHMRHDMEQWLGERWNEYAKVAPGSIAMPQFEYATEKPAAWLTIDDRAITFKGNWAALNLTPDAMLAFKPWNK